MFLEINILNEYLISIMLILVGFPLLTFLFRIIGSNKTSKREKLGDAFNQTAQRVATIVSDVSYDLTTNKETKEIDSARSTIADRNGSIYRYYRIFFYEGDINNSTLNRLFTVDDKLKKSFNILDLSEEEWLRLATRLLFVGIIRGYCHFSGSNSSNRDFFVEMRDPSKVNKLKEALSYFNIEIEEWIKYGDAIVILYHLCDDDDPYINALNKKYIMPQLSYSYQEDY